ncbi:class I SAM-dependent methyltransferase [uncultured Friedmanniella sp.]|uniref:class I SAM-dependent methyltransferase n=1 Tax=uncultured Friedmanniella sp. TaxID=335381 RepID=UPI0035CA3276
MGGETADEVRLRRRGTFARIAEQYALSRPTYPDALFDQLSVYGGLVRGARVLEAAPGTGQATASMAERGWWITAVELSPELAAVARRQLADYPAVDVVVSAFEDWTPSAGVYDAFVCATAYHWLDPATRLARISAALRPRGTVAVVWTHHVAGGTQDFFTDVQQHYLRWDPSARADERLPPEHDVASASEELLDSPLVTDVESHRFSLDPTYSAEEYVALLSTYSPTLALSPTARAGLLSGVRHLIASRFEGRVAKRYLFELVLARTLP